MMEWSSATDLFARWRGNRAKESQGRAQTVADPKFGHSIYRIAGLKPGDYTSGKFRKAAQSRAKPPLHNEDPGTV